jgi:hypothetical protein
MTSNRFSAFSEDEAQQAPAKKAAAPTTHAVAEKPVPRDRSAAKQPNTRPLNAPGAAPAPATQEQQRPRGDRADQPRSGGAGVRKHAGSDRKSGSGRGDGRGFDEKKGGAGKNNWDNPLSAATDPALAAAAVVPAAGEENKPADGAATATPAAAAGPTEPVAEPEPVRLGFDDFLASKQAAKPKLAPLPRERQPGEGDDSAPGKVFVKKVSETSKSGDSFFVDEKSAGNTKAGEGQPKEKDLLFYVNAPAFVPDQRPERAPRDERDRRPRGNSDKPQGERRQGGNQGQGSNSPGPRAQSQRKKPEIAVDLKAFPALGAEIKA